MALAARLMANIERVVHGRRPAVELVVAGLLSGGHVLVQDVPGSGKTTLARSVARSIGGTFRRIQGTADLLPGDITGSSMWDPARLEFVFVPGAGLHQRVARRRAQSCDAACPVGAARGDG